MEIIYSQEGNYKQVTIYASIEEAKTDNAIIRHLCDSGPSKRRKAFELGIISNELYEKGNQLPVHTELGSGCGYKDFSFIAQKGLHQIHGCTFVRLYITSNGKVVLS